MCLSYLDFEFSYHLHSEIPLKFEDGDTPPRVTDVTSTGLDGMSSSIDGDGDGARRDLALYVGEKSAQV